MRPKKDGVSVNIKLEQSIAEQLSCHVVETGLSKTAVVEKALQMYFEDFEAKERFRKSLKMMEEGRESRAISLRELQNMYPENNSYFKPFTPDMIYVCEPVLADMAEEMKRPEYQAEDYETRYRRYKELQNRAYRLVGISAADPRLRSSEAYDCYYDEILRILNLNPDD